ncbi:uncharacterized protein LOC129807893 isoform X2 [Phlebotomus papatasi]|uniref:uncharacterized protein LOC129807893 isoform X2 n=1 Tax=Phlebotomus papatasi TaxID=29031 RepID=UPI002483536E|nr:uncharacterized protein LOC129807893 isoform X2 [Phlebotomus papatasi]
MDDFGEVQKNSLKKQKFTESSVCPGASTSKGGLSSLKEFTAILEKQIEREELQKAGLTPQEQDLYFEFRENPQLKKETQSFRDKLCVINEKIMDYFKDDSQGTKFRRPIDDIAKIEMELLDDLSDVPSLKKRRKLMLKEEKKLEKILRTPFSSEVRPDVGKKSSKSKWDQR